MTALVKQDDFTTALQDMEQTQVMCERLLQTKHYQKIGAEGVYALVAKAKSIGISPLEALNGGLYFVQGKVGMSSETMASLIRQAGHSIVKDPKSNSDVCILHGKRKDNGDTWMCSFSMDDARRAGLAKNMYDKYPAIMLYNRCMSMLARQLFPDVIKGCGYTMEELKEIAISNVVQSYEKNVKLETVPTEEAKIVIRPAAMEIRNEEPKKPTPEEIQKLDDILVECDPEWMKKQIKKLTELPGVKGLSDINCKTYAWLLNLAYKNRDEYSTAINAEIALKEEENAEFAIAE